MLDVVEDINKILRTTNIRSEHPSPGSLHLTPVPQPSGSGRPSVRRTDNQRGRFTADPCFPDMPEEEHLARRALRSVAISAGRTISGDVSQQTPVSPTCRKRSI